MNTIMFTHQPKRSLVDINFVDLSYSVKNLRKKSKIILKNLNGTFKSGELSAILGPSGSGKSTLMNILAGYKTTNLSGSVSVNGNPRNPKKFRLMSCYIMQDDCLTPLLTVREALNISINLKLGKGFSEKEIKKINEEVIEALNLKDCKNNQIRNLSSGEKKRLSIGLELVNNPPVMFLDEPTSGLDSHTCFQTLCLLKSLSREGRTIICTIHQPSAKLIEIFDNLYVLAEGECIYDGKIMDLVPFLSSIGLDCPNYHNPADYVIEVACGEYGNCVQKLVDAVKNAKSQQKTAMTIDIEVYKCPKFDNDKIFPVNGPLQFWILLKRTVAVALRDDIMTKLRLVGQIIVGILVGVLYYDIGNDSEKVLSNIGGLFFINIFVIFTSMVPSILTFPLEMPTFVREHLNHWYNVRAYYFAKTLADIPFQMIMCFGFVLSLYYLMSQPMELSRFLLMLTISFATALTAHSFGLFIGTTFDLQGGVFCAPIFIVPMMLFSGFLLNFRDMPYYMKLLSHISFIKYGLEGTLIAIYGLGREKLDCHIDYCHFRYPERVLEEMSMGDDMATFVWDVCALFGFFLLLRFATYYVLKMKLRQHR